VLKYYDSSPANATKSFKTGCSIVKEANKAFSTYNKDELFSFMSESDINNDNLTNKAERDCILRNLKGSNVFDAYYTCMCKGKDKCNFYNLYPALTRAQRTSYVATGNTPAKDKYAYYNRTTANYFSFSDNCWKTLTDYNKKSG
jgi:hypothetical protein